MELAPNTKPFMKHLINACGIAFGSFLAAVAIQIFLFPNHVIDGGVLGLSLIGARLYGDNWLSPLLIIFNLPFLYLAYKFIRRSFVIQMGLAVLLYAGFLLLLSNAPPFKGDPIEIIAIGGALLGIGVGLIIRFGGCTDGTEILGIILNRKTGFTVGQIVLVTNIFVFAAYGWIFKDWHIAVFSLLADVVSFKMMDFVIAGLEETKSVLIITTMPKKITACITHELGLGLTIIPGIGGFSGKNQDILLVIIERLDLSDLKELVLREDPYAFLVIENLHEVAYGRHVSKFFQRKKHHEKKHFFPLS